ncbi:MAG TPA: NAD(P)-dependent oxidoreductase [Stellaceae bacterium]|nr:NAD(P)-dependent oxidoreductase [Stellaceae bacterium]
MGSLTEAVVLFGAGGFVGRNLVEAFAGRVPLLYGVTASGNPLPGTTRTFAFAGIAEIPPLPAETVVAAAAARRHDARRFAREQSAILAHNSEIATRIYQFCAARGIGEVRLASSSAVYPAEWDVLDDERPLDLAAPPHKGEAGYAWSKRWAEIVADLHRRLYGINTLAFRLTNPYGPWDSLDPAAAHVAPAFAMKALRPGPLFEIAGDPEAERDFIYAADVARVFALSLDRRGEHDSCNLARGETSTVRQLAEAAIAAAGTAKTIAVAAGPDRGVRMRRATARKLRRLFDLPPFLGLEDGMRATVAWYRDALAR